jgi:hypothetical protein
MHYFSKREGRIHTFLCTVNDHKLTISSTIGIAYLYDVNDACIATCPWVKHTQYTHVFLKFINNYSFGFILRF